MSSTGFADRATELRPRPSLNGNAPAETASLKVPLLALAAAFALGIAVARFLDWRGHAHPR